MRRKSSFIEISRVRAALAGHSPRLPLPQRGFTMPDFEGYTQHRPGVEGPQCDRRGHSIRLRSNSWDKSGLGKERLAVIAEGKLGQIFLDPTQEQVAIAKDSVVEWLQVVAFPANPRDFIE